MMGNNELIRHIMPDIRKLPLALFLLAVLAASPNPARADEQQQKKPRFQRTDISLRDGKTRLEWLVVKYSAPLSLSWYKAVEYTVVLNKNRYAGLQDWRLPTREELLSLADYAKSIGYDGSEGRAVFTALQHLGLVNVRDEHYWTSTQNIYNERMAWAVNMRTGIPEPIEKQLYENVIIVRSLL